MAEWLMRRIANLNCVGSIPIRFSKEICRGVCDGSAHARLVAVGAS